MRAVLVAAKHQVRLPLVEVQHVGGYSVQLELFTF